jgi:rhodanese-related sulfurtransferase
MATFALSLTLLWGVSSFAQQPRFPVDQNRLALGAKEKTPDELKQMMQAESKFMLIDVNPKVRFEKETIPGAVNIPLEEIDEGLKKIPRDTALAFVCNSGPRSSQAAKIAEAAGFASTIFCPITKWKREGNETAPGKPNY